MIPAFKSKFAATNVPSFSLKPSNKVVPEARSPISAKVESTSKTPVSLTDSQYEELFASVSKRVLDSDFLDLDERFAGSQEALENGNGFDKFEVKQKKMKKKRKRCKEEVGDADGTNVTPSESFTKSVSKISPDSNKRDNEVTPSVSPHELNTVVIKKPKPQKQKRQPTFKAKRKSLEYFENSGGTTFNTGTADSRTNREDDDENAVEDRHNDSNDTWVQCSKCEKWRILPDCKDPTLLPDIWTCSMNTIVELAKCSFPEGNWDELDSQTEYVYTKFIPGSLVWAKMDGYPPWPSMIDFDPDNGSYYEKSATGDVYQYHVVFLDEKVSRAWVTNKKIEVYREDETPIKLPRDLSRRNEFAKDLHAAKLKAHEAAGMSVPKRMDLFSFSSRFRGKSHWSRDRNSLEKKQKRKAKQKNSSNGESSKTDEAPVDTRATVKLSMHFHSDNDKSAKLGNQTASLDNTTEPFTSPKQSEPPTKDTHSQNDNEEPCESKDTSVISMSDVSLEKQCEGVLQQGMKIESCDSSLNIPFVVIDQKSKAKPIEFDPDVFTMEMKCDGFTDVYESEKSPVKRLEMIQMQECKMYNDGASNDTNSSVADNWFSPSKETGISADNMFDSVTELEHVDQSGNWDELENLVMDIPDCL